MPKSLEPPQSSPPLCPQQAWRDLAWVVTSPSLIAHINGATVVAGAEDPETQTWLAAQQQEPADLLRHLQERDTRLLGSYFEALWDYSLRRLPHLEVIARRQQIRQSGKTVGEFDLLLFDQARQRHLHQELAVKFYLAFADSSGTPAVPHPAVRWIGPNSQDRLDKKLARLETHQLCLSRQSDAQAWLRYQGINQLDVELVLKGYLFYPLDAPPPTPDFVNPSHLRGRWLRANQLNQIAQAGRRWQVLDKSRWLAPALATTEESVEFEALQAWVAANQPLGRARLIAALEANGDHWRELERFFLVPDHWPGPATQR